MKQNIIRSDILSSCYFRTSTKPPFRKALLQITERCNLHCAPCFVSAGTEGAEMSLHDIERIIPKLKELNIISITLTGGEPFLHPDIIRIVRTISDMDIKVSICTNATLITALQMQQLADIGRIHVNVSLDGFRPESHGKFRGDIQSFEVTKSTIRLLGEHQLLHGILVTPNKLAEIEEYKHICQFAVENRASYVLMNPLSQMGRGISSKSLLGSSNQMMERIRKETIGFQQLIQVIYVRFPNTAELPLGSCEAGNIIYVFARGELTVCP
jgi:MoaA/NifB/PqqE/SkfB family radical SAM enzyme